MSDKRVTDLTPIIAPSGEDVFHVVKVSDTTQNPAGSSKKMTLDAMANLITNQVGLIGANAVLKGGIVWLGGLDYHVFAYKYIVNGQLINQFVSDTVTLSNGDATNPRFDVFAVEVDFTTEPPTPSIVVLEGTPGASPVKPTTNFYSQVEVSFRLVLALEATDPNTQNELIYNENTGVTTEWNNSDLPTGASLTATTDPYNGTNYITIPAIASSDDLQWTDTSTHNFDSSNVLVFAYRKPVVLTATTQSPPPQIQILLDDSINGDSWYHTVYLTNIPQSTAWQLISIPFSDFTPGGGVPTTYDRVRFRFVNTPYLEMDYVLIQSNLTQPEPLKTIVSKGLDSGYDYIDVSASAIKGIGSTRVPITDITGADEAYVFEGGFAELDWGSVAFDNNDLDIQTESGARVASISSFLNATADRRKSFVLLSTDNNVEPSGRLYLGGTDSVATGDSPVRVHFKVRKINNLLF